MVNGREDSEFGEFWIPEAIPAATVVVLRDGPAGVETLMLRRDGKLAFAGGMWVFPGGRLDPGDFLDTPSGSDDPVGSDTSAGSDGPGESDNQVGSGTSARSDEAGAMELASRRAALRETREETGLVLPPEALIRWSHWTAPAQAPRRFTTAFYVAQLDAVDSAVTIDNAEIREFVWKSPAEVIAHRDEGVLGLTPPTYITLCQLLRFAKVESLLDAARTHRVEHFETRFDFVGEMMIAMYHGDAGYESGDVHAPGVRHRLSMDSVWRYERDE
ncbi:MAG: NUDIX domain-containing protein [Microthrixaceae bacterium]